MRILLVADGFPPMYSSCAIQMRDLVIEMSRCGHEVAILIPDPGINQSLKLELYEGVRVIRIKSPKTKDIGRLKRVLNEFLTPFIMWSTFKGSAYSNVHWQGIVWYSPSIFFGPIVFQLKRRYKCKTYLILRDIFPEWALDLGLIRKGFSYWVLKAVALQQYLIADTIGVQSPGNLSYLKSIFLPSIKKIEVLNNWLSETEGLTCSINLQESKLANKIIFVYAGNMGIAQGLDSLIELIDQFRVVNDVGFVLVGRGTEFERLNSKIKILELDNVLLFPEINHGQISTLYEQCDIGLVWLNQSHRTHNIPGKFLSYMQAGMPVFANINPGNDLVTIIKENNVGEVCTSKSPAKVFDCAMRLISEMRTGSSFQERSLSLFRREYSSRQAVAQIIGSLKRAS